jgi:hypothetical protein
MVSDLVKWQNIVGAAIIFGRQVKAEVDRPRIWQWSFKSYVKLRPKLGDHGCNRTFFGTTAQTHENPFIQIFVQVSYEINSIQYQRTAI